MRSSRYGRASGSIPSAGYLGCPVRELTISPRGEVSVYGARMHYLHNTANGLWREVWSWRIKARRYCGMVAEEMAKTGVVNGGRVGRRRGCKYHVHILPDVLRVAALPCLVSLRRCCAYDATLDVPHARESFPTVCLSHSASSSRISRRRALAPFLSAPINDRSPSRRGGEKGQRQVDPKPSSDAAHPLPRFSRFRCYA